MAYILAGLAIAVGLLALLPTARFPIEVLASLRPQIAGLCFLLAISAAGVGRIGLGAALLAMSMTLLAFSPGLFHRAAPKLREPALTVVWANIFKDPRAAVRVARLAQATSADVVIVGEPLRDVTGLHRIMAAYPHRFGDEAGRHGVMIYSRTPLEGADLAGAFYRGDYPIVSATVATPSGPLRLIGIHPAVAGSPARLRARDAQILAAARQAETTGRALVVGDFNAPPWTTALRAVRRRTSLRRVSTGVGSTWFAPWPVLGLPIDHALVTSGVEADARVGPATGSDHLPLIVHLR